MDCTPAFWTQTLSFIGAALILIGYAGHQFKWVDAGRPFYNIVNAVGSAILGYIALRPFQLGFVLLEFIWVGVSIYGLALALRRAPEAKQS